MFFVGKNIVVDTSMSDLAARATTSHNNPAPKEDGGGGGLCNSNGKHGDRYKMYCTHCVWQDGGGRGEYRVSNISGSSAVAKLIAE